jgi:FixJ family two-component response regulator
MGPSVMHYGASACEQAPLVLIVDDDHGMRTALFELLQTVDIEAQCFATTQELLATKLPDRPGCLILDIRMPGLSGLELQNRLIAREEIKPIIFLTAHGDVPMSVQAMKAGAMDFLIKPVRDQTLLDAVSSAIATDIAKRADGRVVGKIVSLFETLTPREKQVFRAATLGLLNKQIAFSLGISEVTVKLHRASVMKKMGSTSIADLVRAWELLPPSVQQDVAWTAVSERV